MKSFKEEFAFLLSIAVLLVVILGFAKSSINDKIAIEILDILQTFLMFILSIFSLIIFFHYIAKSRKYKKSYKSS